MTQARPRREKPASRTPEEDADLEARYRLLHRRLKRFAARMEAAGRRTSDQGGAPLPRAPEPPSDARH